MIEPSTCRREAPIVRSVANSRVRCAIVIESEFAITKLPTKSAMPAEGEQEALQEADELVRVLGVLGPPAPRPCAPARSAAGPARSAASSCSVETPGFAATRDLVELAALVEEPLRGREVEAGERRAADRRERRRT